MNVSHAKTTLAGFNLFILITLLLAFSSFSVSVQASQCANNQDLLAQEAACINVRAGRDRHIVLSQTTFLDGSATTQRNGQFLSFNWQLIEKPQGSLVQPFDSQSVKTTFTPDLPGDYLFELTVTAKSGIRATDRVLFSTGASEPVAIIKPLTVYHVGEAVTLDGSQSESGGGGVLGYNWEITQRPEASHAFIDAVNSQSPAIMLDVSGTYGVSLTVNNGSRSSKRVMMTWTTQDLQPVAVAGSSRTFSVGSAVRLDGARSQALNKTELDYQWSILYSPPSSAARLNDSNVASPGFIADRAGYYLIQLVVSNEVRASKPVTVLYEVTPPGRLASMVKASDSTRTLGQTDSDADGVMDLEDNCMLVANPSQRDTDGDGFGNFCDPDFNNDGVVNFFDFFIWQENFLTDDPDADLDGSGSVNFLDGAIMNSYYLLPPGPVGAVRWSSPVDGDWNDPLNWTPQIVPNENLIAIVDVEEDVTVSLIDTIAIVKGLVMNESMVIADGTLEAIDAVELGGQISGAMTRINHTTFNPSMQGSGELLLDFGPHVWKGNTLNINAVIDTGATLFNSAGLTINETLTIDSHWFATTINFTDTQTVDGTGTLVLDGWGNPVNPAIELSPVSQATVTFGPDLLIRGGRAVIGSDVGSSWFLGDVISEISGEELRVGGNTWFASGTFATTSGASLQFFGDLENAGSTVNIDAATGSVSLFSDSDLTSANIVGSAGTVMSVQGGASDWRDTLFDLDLVLENGAEVRVFDDITLNGTTIIQSSSAPTGLCFYSSQVISTAAAFVFDAASNPQPDDAYLCATSNTSAALTLGPDTTISGANGRLYTLSSNAEIVFDGQVNANVADQAIVINSGRFSGDGTFLSTGGGVLEIASDLDNGGAPILIDGSDGRVVVGPDVAFENAVVNATPGTVLEYVAGSDNEIGNLVLNADLFVSNSVLNVTNDLELNGTLTLGESNSSDSVLNFSGTYVLTGDATIAMEATLFPGQLRPKITGDGPGSIINVTIPETYVIRGGSEIRFGSADIGDGINAFVLEGGLFVDSSSFRIRSSSFSIAESATVSLANRKRLSSFNLDSALGNVQIGAGSTFIVTPSNPLSLSAHSTFEIDIASTLLIGRFESSESVEYAGQLTISLTDGYSPVVGDSFELFTHSSFSGEFDSVISEGVNSGESFELSYTPTRVIATLVN